MKAEAASSQDRQKPIYATAPPDMPIPERLNFFLVIFVFVISGAVLTSGLVQLYFAYQETQTAVVGLQRGAAAAAASKIEQFIEQTERQIGWVIPLSSAAGSVTADHKRFRLVNSATQR